MGEGERTHHRLVKLVGGDVIAAVDHDRDGRHCAFPLFQSLCGHTFMAGSFMAGSFMINESWARETHEAVSQRTAARGARWGEPGSKLFMGSLRKAGILLGADEIEATLRSAELHSPQMKHL